MRGIIRFLYSGVGTLLTASVFLTVLYFPNPVGRLEGRLAPVVSEMQVDIKSKGKVNSRVTGSFHVERPGCSFHHLEWYLVTPHRETLMEVNFADGVQARPVGFNTFGPWYVALNAKDLRDRSLAEVYHECPGRPWLTITRFYP